jgi:hypothetical protein
MSNSETRTGPSLGRAHDRAPTTKLVGHDGFGITHRCGVDQTRARTTCREGFCWGILRDLWPSCLSAEGSLPAAGLIRLS